MSIGIIKSDLFEKETSAPPPFLLDTTPRSFLVSTKLEIQSAKWTLAKTDLKWPQPVFKRVARQSRLDPICSASLHSRPYLHIDHFPLAAALFRQHCKNISQKKKPVDVSTWTMRLGIFLSSSQNEGIEKHTRERNKRRVLLPAGCVTHKEGSNHTQWPMNKLLANVFSFRLTTTR